MLQHSHDPVKALSQIELTHKQAERVRASLRLHTSALRDSACVRENVVFHECMSDKSGVPYALRNLSINEL